jgi:hypothetical protein
MKISAKDYIEILNTSFHFYKTRAVGVNFVFSYCDNPDCEEKNNFLPWLIYDCPLSCPLCCSLMKIICPGELLIVGEKDVR